MSPPPYINSGSLSLRLPAEVLHVHLLDFVARSGRAWSAPAGLSHDHPYRLAADLHTRPPTWNEPMPRSTMSSWRQCRRHDEGEDHSDQATTHCFPPCICGRVLHTIAPIHARLPARERATKMPPELSEEWTPVFHRKCDHWSSGPSFALRPTPRWSNSRFMDEPAAIADDQLVTDGRSRREMESPILRELIYLLQAPAPAAAESNKLQRRVTSRMRPSSHTSAMPKLNGPNRADRPSKRPRPVWPATSGRRRCASNVRTHP